MNHNYFWLVGCLLKVAAIFKLVKFSNGHFGDLKVELLRNEVRNYEF